MGGGQSGWLTACVALLSQWAAPTKLVIPLEAKRQGKSTEVKVEALIVRDTSGKVVALDLPRKRP